MTITPSQQLIRYVGCKKTLVMISAASLTIIFGLFLFHFLRRNRLQKSLQAQYSEKKKASEEALWFATLLDDLPVLVSVVDEQFNQVFTNKAHRKYFHNCVKCSNDNYLCALTDPQLHNDEFDETYCANNESYFKRYVHHVENPRTGKKFQILVLDDTTKAHKHKKELVQANQIATKAIDTRSRFLAVITHELRTPINGIVGLLELLERKNNDKEQNMFIDSIRKSAYILNNHVSDILDFSKMEAGENHLVISHTNILIGIDTILKAQQSHALGKNIDFKVYWEPTPVIFFATDIDKVQQVISNLLSNAIKFTESGAVTITLSVTQNSLQFQVQDTGIGMTEEQVQSIFEPFVQADNSTSRRFGGTGLGMTIVDTIIQQFNGSIDISSQVNRGTSITVSIPLHHIGSKPDFSFPQFHSTSSIINSWLDKWGIYNESGQLFDAPLNNEIYETFPSEIYDYTLSATQPGVEIEPKLAQFSAHVLVAEDNKINQLMIKQQLEEIGIHCSMACDGQEAITLFEQDPTKYDLIITDNHMPFVDGFELTKMVRNSQNQSNIAIIGCTADDPKTTHSECLTVGMNDVLYKPYELRDLIEILRRHLPITQDENELEEPNNNGTSDWVSHIKKSNQKELLQVISDSFSSDIEHLTHNPDSYRKIAHKVKGAAQLLKIEHIVELTKEMESFEHHNLTYNELLCSELTKIIKIADEAVP